MSLYVDIEKKWKGFSLNVSFETQYGCLGILGASGCGKSMTLKAAAGIVTPDRGRIVKNGEIVYDSRNKINQRPQERRIGYLFQNYSLFPNMTVEENIMAGLGRKTEENKQKVQTVLEQFQLTGLEKRRPRALSGGQQQRTALARILVLKPDILLLDEPFSALDAYLKEELQLELKEVLKSYEGSSVLVTHDRDEAYRLCDCLMIMEKGRIVEMGPVKEIFQRPVTCQAARLTGCKNISRAVRLSENRVRAVDWNIDLTVCGPVKEKECYVGIRAHDFVALADDGIEENVINRIPLEEPRISPSPFEDNVIFHCNKGGPLWWKRGSADWNMSGELPRYVSAPAEKLMVLV